IIALILWFLFVKKGGAEEAVTLRAEVETAAGVVAVAAVVVVAEAAVVAVNPFLNHPAKKEGVYIQAALVGGWWPPVVVF
ncbi:MAG: hypothetical protein VYD34_06650, partial [Verrucomicrobiota bacterium]|nr:hypothetical protein [Verrucomicrobiota bacterium]